MARWGFQSHDDRAEAASGLPASVPIRDLRRIRLAPDDGLAVLVKEHISQSEAARIHDAMRSVFGSARRIVVLDSGTDLAVIGESR
jgi:hypothetical protein